MAFLSLHAESTDYLCTCHVSRVHRVTRVHVVWTDRDGNVGLSWNMLEKLFGTRLHTAHEGNGVFSVHVVHDIEVAHLITGGGTADKRRERLAADWTDPQRTFTGHQPAGSRSENTHPM